MMICEGFLKGVLATALLIVMMPVISWSQMTGHGEFNLFSPQQEIEIGRDSAQSVERRLPLISDPGVNGYVSRIGQTLIARAPGERYPYSLKIADLPDINAFAFPGGSIYVTKGAVDFASSEGELAGLIAHEIAHIALRHGASQASKAYLAQAGLGVFGGVVSDSEAPNIIGAVGGLGFNTVFLKYSPGAESEADTLSARILSLAGYDPDELMNFFRRIYRCASSDAIKSHEFFGDHPSPEIRLEWMRREFDQTPAPQRGSELFHRFQTYVARASRALRGMTITMRGPTVNDESLNNRAFINFRAERPSSRLRDYWQSDGLSFHLSYPENWQAIPSSDKLGVIFTPVGGFVEANGKNHLVCGAVVNRYRTIGDNSQWTGLPQRSFRYIGGRGELTEATNDLVDSVLQNNPYLDYNRGSDRRGQSDGLQTITLTFTGRSPLTGRSERAQLYTRELGNNEVLYAIFVAPNDDYEELRPMFDRLLRGLKIEDGALYRGK